MVIADGDIITAGGLMAWTDPSLRLVARLLGLTVIAETGSFMLIDSARRELRHYSPRAYTKMPGARLATWQQSP